MQLLRYGKQLSEVYNGSSKNSTFDEQTELNYRFILERIKKETNAKIVMLAPYVLDAPARIS